MRSSIAPIFALAGAASALSLEQITQLLTGIGPAPITDPRFQNWTPPGPNDLRSPCPGLNTAANHGFINHSGRDLNIPDLIHGLAASMNIGADFSVAISGVALLSSPNPLGGSFTLSDIDEHNFPIEHDASITRQDAYLANGDDYSFHAPNFAQYFDSFGSANVTSIKSVADAKDVRYQDSLKRNPQFTFGPRETVLSFGENALAVQFLSDPTSGVARLDWMKYWFQNERFPVELGWQPSEQPVTLLSLGSMIVSFYAEGPEPLPEGARIVEDSYKDLFAAVAGGSNVLNNLTQGISGFLGL